MLNKEKMEGIKQSMGGIHRDPIINHPYKEYAMNLKIFLPIMNKFPFLKPIVKKRFKNKKNNLIRTLKPLSIYFMHHGRHPKGFGNIL